MDIRDILLLSEAEKELNRGNISRESYVIELWFLSPVTNKKQSPALCTGGLFSSASEKPQTPMWAITVSHGSFGGIIFSGILFF